MYKRVDEVLHFLWDSIGIADIPEARDEYYGYLPQVFSLAKNDSSAEEIAEYLSKTQKNTMELSSNDEKNLELAELILLWKEIIIEKNKDYAQYLSIIHRNFTVTNP